MAEFERLHVGNSEVQEKQGLAFNFAQTATVGLAATGVLTGLMVNQTATPSGSIVVAAGAGVIGSTVGAGVSEAINPGDVTFNVLTANPVGGLPRNDIIVWDSVTKAFGVIVGTPNAAPSDPSVANTKLPLGRLRHAASATTIPLAKIDDLRVFTGLLGVPIPVSSQAARNALVAYLGLQVKRLDVAGCPIETYDGASWSPPRAIRGSWVLAAPLGVGTGMFVLIPAATAVGTPDASFSNSGGAITLGKAGSYQVTVVTIWSGAGGTRRVTNLTLNAAAIAGTGNVSSGAVVGAAGTVPGDLSYTVTFPPFTAAVGDVLRAFGFHDSTGALTVGVGATTSYLGMSMVSVVYLGA